MVLAEILVSPNSETFQIIMTTKTAIQEVDIFTVTFKSNKSFKMTSISGSKLSAGSIVVSVMITMLVITFCGWLGYAYFNPNTSSGRFLIKVNDQ